MSLKYRRLIIYKNLIIEVDKEMPLKKGKPKQKKPANILLVLLEL